MYSYWILLLDRVGNFDSFIVSVNSMENNECHSVYKRAFLTEGEESLNDTINCDHQQGKDIKLKFNEITSQISIRII